MIYFIEAGDYVKCGYSRNIALRLHQLQAGNPLKLKLVLTCDGEFKTEKALHLRMQAARVRREWFKNDRIVQETIKLASQGAFNRNKGNEQDSQQAEAGGMQSANEMQVTIDRLAGHSAERVAAVSGLHAQTIRKLRRGEHSPTWRTMQALQCAADSLNAGNPAPVVTSGK